MTTLAEYLDRWASGSADRPPIAATVAALAQAAAELSELVRLGPLAGAMAEVVAESRDGTGQKALDVRAEELFEEKLRAAPVAYLASEELDHVLELRPGAPLAVALDPLDGSANIEQASAMGAIFSILPAGASGEASFLVPGHRQLAAGSVLYGSFTAMVLSLGEGVDSFALDPRTGRFVLAERGLKVAQNRREYAINASNARHWTLPVRAFIEECLAGATGPLAADYNMRWVAAVVADLYRILVKGGIFLYPGDARKGYEHGRLRLLYEAFPIAFLIEQAGGAATDGYGPILERAPKALHERTPLIFGARDMVERVSHLHHANVPPAGQRPLFGQRGLFKSGP
ncbi:MAG: class 1 fructose-bisphosphatase [Geminicoccaceae bacterium]|nr:class 1 fructose-bisphosphatase [Geminicoccaceae bacterium]MCX8100282.1 class 1 fructose-bisphosphatase [Geminicoccaceae bacterium]MDW8371016.1 class 1 fructose-bisphosphatase [Geminicoccaceae bacterium]